MKWAGALAAVGVVGVGLGFGADILIRPSSTSTVTKTNAPTNLSYVPPLSPEVQSTVAKTFQTITSARSGDQIFYTNCKTNGCIATACVLKVHVNSAGTITGVEPDSSSINPNNPREDVGLDLIKKGRIRYAGCPIGMGIHAEEYLPSRILYPMKRVGPRGSGQFVRITWDEATTQIASDIQDTVSKYGPYSIWESPWGMIGMWPTDGFVFGPYMPGGIACWGDHSFSAVSIPELLTEGQIGWLTGCSPADILNSKLVLLFGKNSSRTEQVAWPYLIRLAKENGTKIIYLDPRYSPTAETMADQWIPIRPGTDLALMLALCNVMFKQNLIDSNYVNSNVDPVGLAKFKDYVLGNTAGSDGAIDRTPQWAEAICGVPADTITALATLYVSSKPTKLLLGLGIGRADYLNTSRLAIYLQALTGNLSVAGGGDPFMHNHFMSLAAGPMPVVNWGRKQNRTNPILMNLLRWHDAILYRQQLDAGQITTAQFNQLIGNKQDNTSVPNIQMVVFDCNYLNNQFDVNRRIQAIKSIAHVWGFQWYAEQPTGKYMDIILPAPVWFFEDPGVGDSGSGIRFLSGGTFDSHFLFASPAVPASKLPGEVRPVEWAMIQIADKLGFGSDYNPTLYDQVKGDWNPTAWDSAILAASKTAYEYWAKNTAIAPLNPPSWDDFLKNPVFYQDAPQMPPFSGLGANPWAHNDGNMKTTDKIEIDNAFLANHDAIPNTVFGPGFAAGTCLGKVGDAVTSFPTWNYGMYGSYYDQRLNNYPLVLLTLETGFRSHSAHFNNPLLKDDSYRHAVWLSAYDAAQRGINDGDTVRIYSNVGEAILEAYVTNKLIPGVAALGHGGWYLPDSTKTALNPDGIDRGGAPNLILEDVQPDKMTIGPSLDKGVCQVEKF